LDHKFPPGQSTDAAPTGVDAAAAPGRTVMVPQIGASLEKRIVKNGLVRAGQNPMRRPQMKRKRRQHSPEFKARVALEAARGVKTINQIAEENEIHPVQVSQWKQQLEERMAGVFERDGKKDREVERKERRSEQLERKVGQLLVEKEFLEKKCDQLGIDLNERP